MSENERYLRLGGWMQGRSGWWHPPSCLASWPEADAVRMARADEKSGSRMTEADLREYLRDQRFDAASADSYIASCKPPTGANP